MGAAYPLWWAYMAVFAEFGVRDKSAIEHQKGGRQWHG
jgi:hypothetical protein